jgi:BarA-like signal transduction histidine kinase
LSYKQYLELQKDSLQQDLDSLEIKKLQLKFKDQIKADSLKQIQAQDTIKQPIKG